MILIIFGFIALLPLIMMFVSLRESRVSA